MITDSASEATDETAEAAEPSQAEPSDAQTTEGEVTAGRRKQKVSLSLDADLIRQLKTAGPLSPQVNEAIRAQLAHQLPASTGADD
jgi:uncharacterized protein (DUF4415 family)